jgi:hypothetical protein
VRRHVHEHGDLAVDDSLSNRGKHESFELSRLGRQRHRHRDDNARLHLERGGLD